jgi:hypothetical protein
MDLDFGNGSKYPRVSPAALALGQNAPLDPGRGSLLQFNGSITYQPTNELRTQFSINSQRLGRYDTDRVAYNINIMTFRGTYQFTKATFTRLILDYNTLDSRMRAQALLGWTPSPGTARLPPQRPHVLYQGFVFDPERFLATDYTDEH